MSASCTTEIQASDRTLGELLYADPSRVRVSEEQWTELVRSTAAGDARALQALYDHSHRLVFTLAFRLCGNRETAEELTVDVFHDIWRKAGSYDAEAGTVLAWIMMQARSRAIDRLRFDQRKKRVDDGTLGPLVEDEANDLGDVIGLLDDGTRLRAALGLLTPDERLALEAAFFAEMSYQEVAVKLCQPLGTIKTRIRSALAKLRQSLAESDAP